MRKKAHLRPGTPHWCTGLFYTIPWAKTSLFPRSCEDLWPEFAPTAAFRGRVMRAEVVICAQWSDPCRHCNHHWCIVLEGCSVFVCIVKEARVKCRHEAHGPSQTSASRHALLVPDRAVIRPVDHPFHPLPQAAAPDEYGRASQAIGVPRFLEHAERPVLEFVLWAFSGGQGTMGSERH